MGSQNPPGWEAETSDSPSGPSAVSLRVAFPTNNPWNPAAQTKTQTKRLSLYIPFLHFSHSSLQIILQQPFGERVKAESSLLSLPIFPPVPSKTSDTFIYLFIRKYLCSTCYVPDSVLLCMLSVHHMEDNLPNDCRIKFNLFKTHPH